MRLTGTEVATGVGRCWGYSRPSLGWRDNWTERQVPETEVRMTFLSRRGRTVARTNRLTLVKDTRAQFIGGIRVPVLGQLAAISAAVSRVGRVRLRDRALVVACVLAIVLPPAAASASQSTFVGPGASIAAAGQATTMAEPSSPATTPTSITPVPVTQPVAVAKLSITTQTAFRRTVVRTARVKLTVLTLAT